MQLPSSFSIDPLSFLFGFIIATAVWWMVARARPLWKEIGENLKARQEASQAHRASGLEENHRRVTLRRAQGMHLAAPLFALNEIIQEPMLLAPPPHVEPGGPLATEDAVSLTLPYLPAWPEIAAVYDAHRLTLGEALSGGMNIVIIGQPGIGKTVALAHLASLAANGSDALGPLKDSIPFLLHVADLRLPAVEAKSVIDRLIEMTSEHAALLDVGRVPAFVQTAFRSGRALMLLDGFDELTPDGQREVSESIRLLLQEYPKTRIVITGAPEYLDGLLALRFVPLALAGWNKQSQSQFMYRWGVLWTHFVGLEAWVQSGPAQVDPILLNTWLGADNQFLTPLELTLKVWAAYAGDAVGPQVREAIVSHVRRLAPTNTPLAALETLAMQVTLASQPVFDPSQARVWVKAFELPEESGGAVENVAGNTLEDGAEPADDKASAPDRKKEKKRGRNLPSPAPGLLGRLASTGLVVAYPNNKMRFAHPIFSGLLAGRALTGFKADDNLLKQPDWIGKLLAMRYLAAHGDATSLVKNMLEWSRLPMHRPMLAAARWLRGCSPLRAVERHGNGGARRTAPKRGPAALTARAGARRAGYERRPWRTGIIPSIYAYPFL